MGEKYPCPVCGFLVFEEPAGSYDICKICGWEDDHVQLTYPAMRGGANRDSLAEQQAIWLKRYPLEVRDASGCARDPTWRPLFDAEIVPHPAEPESGKGYFHAAGAESPEYYWRSKGPK